MSEEGGGSQPRYGWCRRVSPASFNSGLWARLVRRTLTFPLRSRRCPACRRTSGTTRDGPASKPFSRPASFAVQQVGQHRQRQVEVHVQTHVAAQAIQVEERDLFTQAVLDVIPAGVGLDDLAGRLPLRPVVGQEEGRRFVPQPRHDQLPQLAFVAVESDPFIDISGPGGASPWPG